MHMYVPLSKLQGIQEQWPKTLFLSPMIPIPSLATVLMTNTTASGSSPGIWLICTAKYWTFLLVMTLMFPST